MTTQTDPNAFLLGGGGKSASFPEPGTTVTGTIADPPEVRQQTSMNGDPLTWDNGDPRLQLVVSLKTQQREDPDDDGIRKLYVKGSKDPKSKSLHAAVAAAVAEAGAKGLEVGGTLSVTYTGDGVASQRGFNPPKQYQARYTRPDTSATSGDFLGTGEQVNTQTGEISQQQPAAGDQPSPAQIAALKAAGLGDDKIREIYPTYQPA